MRPRSAPAGCTSSNGSGLFLAITSLLAAGLLAGGCSSFTRPARMHELGSSKPYWFDYDASRRGAILVVKNGNPSQTQTVVCAEPSPDVALELANKIVTEAEAKGVQAKGEASFTAGVVDLAKRTQTIMFLREALFRLCEQSLNHAFDATDLVKLYSEVIATAFKLHQADLAQKQLELARTLKEDPATRKLMENLFQQSAPQ